MSPHEPARHDRAEGKAADERVREQGTVIITRLLATMRTGRAYKVGNQVFTRQLESFIECVLQALAESGEAVFVELEGDLYLNGARLPVKPNTLRFHESVRKEFEMRKIAGFRATKGLNLKEVEVFFELFLQADMLQGPVLLQACIARGDKHLLPVVHASAEAPGEGPTGSAEGGEGDGTGAEVRTVTSSAAGLIGEESSSGWNLDRGANKKAFLMALQGMRTLLHAPQEGVELRHAKRVVQPLVDGAFSSEPVVVGLTGLSQHDDYTYAHAVNVCLVAVNIGQVLGLDRRQLADLGVAVLLHDVGKGEVANQIHHPPEEFTPEERAAAERHTVMGARLITKNTVLNQTTLRCIRVAFEHHMGPGGTGYPHTDPPWGPSLLSRVTAVADCYVNLLTHRSERGKGMTPYKALSIMFGPLQDRGQQGGAGAAPPAAGAPPQRPWRQGEREHRVPSPAGGPQHQARPAGQGIPGRPGGLERGPGALERGKSRLTQQGGALRDQALQVAVLVDQHGVVERRAAILEQLAAAAGRDRHQRPVRLAHPDRALVDAHAGAHRQAQHREGRPRDLGARLSGLDREPCAAERGAGRHVHLSAPERGDGTAPEPAPRRPRQGHLGSGRQLDEDAPGAHQRDAGALRQAHARARREAVLERAGGLERDRRPVHFDHAPRRALRHPPGRGGVKRDERDHGRRRGDRHGAPAQPCLPGPGGRPHEYLPPADPPAHEVLLEAGAERRVGLGLRQRAQRVAGTRLLGRERGGGLARHDRVSPSIAPNAASARE